MGRRDKQVALKAGEELPIGSRLRVARQERGITLTDMANHLGFSKGYLSAFELGKERSSKDLVNAYEQALEEANLWHQGISGDQPKEKKMELRDMLAMAALIGIVSARGSWTATDTDWYRSLSTAAYELADAMLEARQKPLDPAKAR